MKLFEFEKKSYNVNITEEALLLAPFKAVYNKDKSKTKDLALKEFAFMWFYADITSPYQGVIDLSDRCEEIKKDIDLPKSWKIDKALEVAIEFYKVRSKTVIHSLYDAAMIAVSAVNGTLKDAKNLIDEAKDPIDATQKILSTIEKVPKVMQNLREAEKELIRQIEDKEGKKIGSKSFSLYEEGLIID